MNHIILANMNQHTTTLHEDASDETDPLDFDQLGACSGLVGRHGGRPTRGTVSPRVWFDKKTTFLRQHDRRTTAYTRRIETERARTVGAREPESPNMLILTAVHPGG